MDIRQSVHRHVVLCISVYLFILSFAFFGCKESAVDSGCDSKDIVEKRDAFIAESKNKLLDAQNGIFCIEDVPEEKLVARHKAASEYVQSVEDEESHLWDRHIRESRNIDGPDKLVLELISRDLGYVRAEKNLPAYKEAKRQNEICGVELEQRRALREIQEARKRMENELYERRKRDAEARKQMEEMRKKREDEWARMREEQAKKAEAERKRREEELERKRKEDEEQKLKEELAEKESKEEWERNVKQFQMEEEQRRQEQAKKKAKKQRKKEQSLDVLFGGQANQKSKHNDGVKSIRRNSSKGWYNKKW